MDPRKTTHSSAGPKDTSPALGTASADIPPRPPVALPSDLATSLRYLEGSELQRLQAARRRSRDEKRALRQAEPTRLLRLARPDQYRRLLKLGTLSKFRKERQISFGRHSVRG